LKSGSQGSLVLERLVSSSNDQSAVKFGEYKHIRRAAFVGDQKWIAWFTRVIGPFTRAEEKHFPEGQLEAAIDWAAA
jgi:hypothetical protein